MIPSTSVPSFSVCSGRLPSRMLRAKCSSSIAITDVRLGVDASAALRWKLLADITAAIGGDAPIRRGSLPDEPAEQAMHELIALAGLVVMASAREFDVSG